MMINELKFFLLKYKYQLIIFVFQLIIFFTLISTIIAFTSEINQGKKDIESIYKNKTIFQLVDGYADPNDFKAFFEEPNSLMILKNFYNGLNNAKNFQYLAMFNQPIEINTSKKSFFKAINKSENDWEPVLAFQMNKNAIQYFHLSTNQGRTFQNTDYDTKGNTVPILLGNNYKNKLKLGDEIEAHYYKKKINLKVVGFLKKNSVIYFNGDSEFYLDDYIIIPYLNEKSPKSDFENWYQKVNYFARINGYISITDKKNNKEKMLFELEAISEKAGFYNYTFIGGNPHMQQYRGLINILNQNYKLIFSLIILMSIINIITLCIQIYLLQQKRISSLSIHFLNGATMSRIVYQILLENSLIVLFSLLFTFGVIKHLKIINPLSIVYILGLGIIFILIMTTFATFKLKHIDLINLLNQEGNEL